ncbi:MAG: Abi family protein [Micrococcaceae bacterium]
MSKVPLTLAQQEILLRNLGLSDECNIGFQEVLCKDNFSRLSEYFKHFQHAPLHGDNTFKTGSDLSHITSITASEAKLRSEVLSGMFLFELYLRGRFSNLYSFYCLQQNIPITGIHFLKTLGPTNSKASEYVDESKIIQQLNQSKDKFILKCRDPNLPNSKQNYEDLPIWDLTETLSFGVLTRCINASHGTSIFDTIADELSVRTGLLTNHLIALNVLRNMCAHPSRLWNKDMKLMPKYKARNFSVTFGKFSHKSIFKVLIVLDRFLDNAGLQDNWLEYVNDEILKPNTLFQQGIMNPQRFPRPKKLSMT